MHAPNLVPRVLSYGERTWERGWYMHLKRRHFGGKTWYPSSFYDGFWRVFLHSGGNKLSKVKSFIILRTREGLKITVLTFLANKGTMKLSGVSSFKNTRKNLRLNFVLVIALVLDIKVSIDGSGVACELVSTF